MQGLLKDKLSEQNFNFEGYVFSCSVNFKDFVFSEFANFENCQFLGRETLFYKTRFTKGALFNQTVFRGMRVNFSKAELQGDFNLFHGTSFESHETLFLGTKFLGKHTAFASAKFSSPGLSFKEAEFQGSLFFTECHFNFKTASFEKIKFTGELLSFVNSRFEGQELKFKETLFSGEKIDFSKTSFEVQELDFSEAVFQGGTSDFSHALFQTKKLKFYPLHLQNTTTHFRYSEFSGDEKTIFILNPEKNDLSFQGVFFHGGRTKLKGDLHAASFIDTSLDNVDFNEARWETRRGRLVCRDEIDADRVNKPGHYQKAMDVCRNIKQCFENFGSYETAGDFYYGEMECKRKLRPRQNWNGLQFIRLTSGYGEKPIRVILTSLFVVFFCACLYLLGGIKTSTRIIHYQTVSDFFTASFVYDFLNCIYFSFVSFTTLGDGDYHPLEWGRVIWASEGFMGAFFISMFVLTIGRKMNR